MNVALKEIAAKMNRMSSQEAADWLMKEYPVDGKYGDVFTLLAHKSWRKEDQKRLAQYYLQKIPFASAKPYEVFASFMSFRQLMDVITERLPTDAERMSLLRYHLEPVLRGLVKSAADVKSLETFLRSDKPIP